MGYKACVKNSLSFSTLPTKPFPRRKDTELGGEGQATWEPVPSQRAAPPHSKPASLLWSDLHLHRYHCVSLMQALNVFFNAK